MLAGQIKTIRGPYFVRDWATLKPFIGLLAEANAKLTIIKINLSIFERTLKGLCRSNEHTFNLQVSNTSVNLPRGK